MISAVNFPIQAIGRKKPEKYQGFDGIPTREALIFFRLLPSNCLNWKIYCDDHSSLSSTTTVQNMNFIYFTSFYCMGRYELNKLTLLPKCGFTAQLVERHTVIAEVTGLNPIEALIFFRLLPSNCINWKIYCDDHFSLSSTTAVQKFIRISYISQSALLFSRWSTN